MYSGKSFIILKTRVYTTRSRGTLILKKTVSRYFKEIVIFTMYYAIPVGSPVVS